MTSSQIRQSFLDFFKSKQHSIVPSSSLMPDSPNLLFTNAGMNQFVPIFLGQKKPDVSKWAGAVPGLDTRAADTQKCIRAGGKHNDLDDVGLDTYHHTFFEMLGNWSFGDYFKKEAIAWAWELVVEKWKFPPARLYATVYSPDKSQNDPSEFDQEAWDCWAEKFRSAGLDPKIHIVNGNKKDNFWMMGETGPCGPCSELHVDLTPAGDTKGSLVNQGDARCIEIWNLVFIQFNANPDGTFSPLPAKHVDTGMGFERVTSIMQGTHGLKDFANAQISNYETDIFRPIFNALEKLSGKKYGSTLPGSAAVPAASSVDAPIKSTGESPSPIIEVDHGTDVSRAVAALEDERGPSAGQIAIDIAFRVIADHIRTLSFAIADGIQPGNNDRNYVLRRILRRAVRYGRTLGFREPFFYKLVDVLAETMGDVFPEIRAKKKQVQDVIRTEEEAFNKTLDRGIAQFEEEAAKLLSGPAQGGPAPRISGAFAFRLYDEQGFPFDLTELMARERGLSVDKEGFEKLMQEQKARARAAQKKEVISLSQIETTTPTKFVGYDTLSAPAKVLEVVGVKDKTAVVLDASPLYAEMGGQVGDTGEIIGAAARPRLRVVSTQKSGNTWLHFVEGDEIPTVGATVTLNVEKPRRNAIQRHHTVTHLLHWALHEVVSKEASQKGSFVGPDKLTRR
jgi:alanyl-tRNA synthetase